MTDRDTVLCPPPSEYSGLLASTDDAAVYHCDWRELATIVTEQGGCDALIFDAPYSERTHASHDTGMATADKKLFAERKIAAGVIGQELYEARYAAAGGERRKLNYAYWTPTDVAEFVAAWAPVNRGWWVSLTDHVLATAWAAEFERAGLYVFSPLACMEPGSRVRMTGDGPAQWSCQAIVARPKGEPYSKWGSLPGGYTVPPGQRGEWRHAYGGSRVVGGKPPWLMERLVEDYSRKGDLVVDPVAGGFTTGLAAVSAGRRFVGGDALLEHAELGQTWLAKPKQRRMFL